MCRYMLALCVGMLALSIGAVYAEDESPTMRQIARASSLPRAHADFSLFHFVPAGDRFIEQPDRSRLIFRKKDGRPDGYAERRGGAVFYYDAAGKLVRIQHFTEDEMNQMAE